MENKLISLSEYIELQEKLIPYENSGTVAECDRMFVRRVISYQRFLKQPLTLGMFIPVGENGNVISEKYDSRVDDPNKKLYQLVNEYNNAKDYVLFKGFSIKDETIIFPDGSQQDSKNINNLTIEDLCYFNPELTESALKQT